MKLNKMNQIIPAIACTSILLTSFALSHDPVTTKQETKKDTAEVTKKQVNVDPAINTITKEILEPVRLQSLQSQLFTRIKIIRNPKSYELVETHSDNKEVARFFDILVSQKPLKTSTQESENINQTTKAKPEPKPTIYLKIKYLTDSNKVLIQQGSDWVEKSKHRFLKLLPVATDKK